MTDASPAYRVRTPETWGLARDAYLAGETARSVCRRFGLGLSALRRRARLEGWRRGDLSDPEPIDPEAELEAVEDVDFSAMALTARRRLQLALIDGEARDAVRWLDLFETLSALAAEAASVETTEPVEPHEVHQLHSDFSDPVSEPDEAHERRPDLSDVPPVIIEVLNRALRRRRLRAERLRRSSA